MVLSVEIEEVNEFYLFSVLSNLQVGVDTTSLLHSQCLVFILQHCNLTSKLLNVFSLDLNLPFLRIIVLVSTRTKSSDLFSTIRSSYKLFSLLYLLKNNLELFSATKFTEFGTLLYSNSSKLLDICQKLLVIIHDVIVVFFMDSFLFFKPLLQSLNRIV